MGFLFFEWKGFFEQAVLLGQVINLLKSNDEVGSKALKQIVGTAGVTP